MADYIRVQINLILEYNAEKPHFPVPDAILHAVAKSAGADGWLEGGRITFSRAAPPKPKPKRPRTFAQSIARKAARHV